MTGATGADLVQTDAEKAALAAVQELTGATRSVLELHGVRVFVITELLAARRSVELDREVILVAALLHDIGLYDGASRGGVYVTDGAEFTADLLHPYGWDEERLKLCFDTIERHHEIKAQWAKGDEVELFRRADLVDVSAGLVNFGLPRGELRGLMRAVPRDHFYGSVGKLLLKAARERPTTLPRIFSRG